MVKLQTLKYILFLISKNCSFLFRKIFGTNNLIESKICSLKFLFKNRIKRRREFLFSLFRGSIENILIY